MEILQVNTSNLYTGLFQGVFFYHVHHEYESRDISEQPGSVDLDQYLKRMRGWNKTMATLGPSCLTRATSVERTWPQSGAT